MTRGFTLEYLQESAWKSECFLLVEEFKRVTHLKVPHMSD